MKAKVSLMFNKIQDISFYTVIVGIFLVAGSSNAYAWDVNTASNGLRTALATIIFVIAAIMAIKAYAKGRKGAAVAEILVGALLWVFINSEAPMKSIGEAFKTMFGF